MHELHPHLSTTSGQTFMTPPPHFTSMPTVRRIAEVFTAHDTIEGDGVRTMLLFSGGDEVHVQSSGEGVRFLFFSGKPIQEPVAWGGPIVMNTQKEVRRALPEYTERDVYQGTKVSERTIGSLSTLCYVSVSAHPLIP